MNNNLENFFLLHFIKYFLFLKSVGCDGIIDSGLILDSCGICGGGDKDCSWYEGIFVEPILQKGYHPVVSIPKGAMSLNISELRFSRNFLGQFRFF